MDSSRKKALALYAAKLRLLALEGIYSAKSGHPGGSLSAAEILTYLYQEEMNIDPANPRKPDRDRFVLSKGHVCPGLYAALALRGFFPTDAMKTLRKPDSILQGHPDMRSTPGVDMSSGSLGQGISAACGMALSAKLSDNGYRVYALMGDGELQEGQCWEAFMFAAHYKLDNLCAIIDKNELQIDGKVSDVMGIDCIAEKYRAFNWHVIELDGHDPQAIHDAFDAAKKVKGRPTVLVAHTVKGKGVSFMEAGGHAWHGRVPTAHELDLALAELAESARQEGGDSCECD